MPKPYLAMIMAAGAPHFDEVCACEHTDGVLVCMCMKPKEESKMHCPDCGQGIHLMMENP